jgi:hypothetical protein
MKKKMFLITLALLVFGYLNAIWACEIEIDIQSDLKKNYEINDVFFVKVKVFLTHRNCPEGIKATKYKLEGLKVLGASQWKAESDTVFTRILKIKIVGAEDHHGILHVIRTCDKEGGYGKLIVNVNV